MGVRVRARVKVVVGGVRVGCRPEGASAGEDPPPQGGVSGSGRTHSPSPGGGSSPASLVPTEGRGKKRSLVGWWGRGGVWHLCVRPGLQNLGLGVGKGFGGEGWRWGRGEVRVGIRLHNNRVANGCNLCCNPLEQPPPPACSVDRYQYQRLG